LSVNIRWGLGKDEGEWH